MNEDMKYYKLSWASPNDESAFYVSMCATLYNSIPKVKKITRQSQIDKLRDGCNKALLFVKLYRHAMQGDIVDEDYIKEVKASGEPAVKLVKMTETKKER